MLRFLAVLWTLVLLWGMLSPGSGVPDVFSVYDKATHAAAFFLFALLWTLGQQGPLRPRLVRTALLAAGFAVGTEVLQAALPIGRFGDVLDVAADLVGAGLGLGVAAMLLRRRLSTSLLDGQ